jgi:glycosyltransferase involved in cell wall biosynthesis
VELGIPDDMKIIGTVGRLVPIKDHKTFLFGAKLILESEPNVRFVIVGDGPLMAELKKQSYELDIATHVCFTGFREDTDILLNMFDVFCLTSIHEGIPMALLEAMSLGKPIVATRVGGISEVIDDNGSGLLIDSENPQSFADACIKVLRDKNLRASLSERAVSVVKEKFTLDVTVRLTQDLYRRVVQS